MTSAQVNTEIKNTREKMAALKSCMKDKSLSAFDRSEYYRAYLVASTYLLTLEAVKPAHNLTIA